MVNTVNEDTASGFYEPAFLLSVSSHIHLFLITPHKDTKERTFPELLQELARMMGSKGPKRRVGF